MGWFLRKSLRFGPLRINLSKSGVGASVGVTGLRVGTGPKGSYLQGGRDGLYFKQPLSTRLRQGDPLKRDREKLASEEIEQQTGEDEARVQSPVGVEATSRGWQTGKRLVRAIFGGLMRR